MVMLFILGGMQGLIGWLMVKSGLNDDDLYVSHFKLAIHFIAAMILIAYTLVFALSLLIPANDFIFKKKLKTFSWYLLIIVVIQLIYGSFMAGIHAATAAPTWPLINGSFIPPGIFNNTFVEKALHDPITIQFIHRGLAYIIFVMILIWWWQSGKMKAGKWFSTFRKSLLFLVVLQVCLGIFTLLNGKNIVPGQFGIYEWLAEFHQLTGMLLFLCMVSIVYVINAGKHHS